ncbi:MAG: DNA-binding PadR family transcriptional regulator [Natronomonas sp.]|jgi:DNA-binding PadR family transcriptional regulator|uniref:PadR family transcriptional regulator n=1 Tax=Natronomonas sp. TaxID=2184060 RepID=UPI003989EEBD
MSSQEGQEPTLASLVTEIRRDGTTESDDPAARTEAVVDEASETLFSGDNPNIDDGLIKQSLPELLLLLVGLRETDAHGKGIMEDLNRFFGAQLSPGTVYPALHDLEEAGLLEMRELVQTKEYRIDDTEAVRETLREGMGQHLALGFVFQRALQELGEDDE